MKRMYFAIFAYVICNGIIFSQEELTVEKALEIALENNYSIQNASNTKRIAENNKSIFNQEILPIATANGQGAYDNTHTHRSENDIKNKSHTITYPLSVSANISFRIFDGSRVHNIQQLKERYALSDLQLRQAIENIVYQVYSTYYQVAELEEDKDILFNNLQLSKRRLQRAKLAIRYGVGNMLEALNAEVDINTDSINYLNSLKDLANARRNLNVLLGRNVFIDFTTNKHIDFHQDSTVNYYLQAARIHNSNWKISEKNEAIEALNLKIAKAGWLPNIDAVGGYSWNKTFYEKSAIDYLQNSGWNAQLSLKWNIFDGGKTKTNIDNARINIENQKILRQEIMRQLERNVVNKWQDYRNALVIYNFRRSNIETATHNYERSLEQFKKGNINSITLRTAQVNLLNTELSLLRAKYDAKLFEIDLLRYSGLLVK